jgi:hypothetical protein
MDLLQRLKEDRRQIARTFAALERTTFRDRRLREALVAELDETLADYVVSERHVLFASRLDDAEGAALLFDAMEGSASLQVFLETLRDKPADADDWRRAVAALKEQVGTHLATEEDLLEVLCRLDEPAMERGGRASGEAR